MGSANYQFFYFAEKDIWFQKSYVFEAFSSLQLYFQFTIIIVQLLSCIDSCTCHGLQYPRLSYPSLSLSLLKLMFIESVMPSNHLILCHPLLLLPPLSQYHTLFQCFHSASGGQSIGAPASASVLPMNIWVDFL